jgi:hypothetical protein
MILLGWMAFTIPGDRIDQVRSARDPDLVELQDAFTNPPNDCRPDVLWDWMGGLISKEGIRADLESMAMSGIGGVMVMQMPDQCPYPRRWSYRDYPGKIKCLSDGWFEMVNFAIGEADRLGLTFSIFMCPGWSHCGAPWITPEKGLKKLVSRDTVVAGPGPIEMTVPKSPPLPGTMGGNLAPEWSSDFNKQPTVKDPFYQDIILLAVPDLEDESTIPLNQIRDISGNMSSKGMLKWEVPEGSWRIIRIGLASENGMNHPAPLEGSGLECDRFDPDAVKLVFNGIAGRIQREAMAKGYGSFKGFETDSYEAGYQDFGKDFQEDFQRRRGYDCSYWLPAWLYTQLTLESEDKTRRFRYDMRQTINELWTERFHETLRRLADDHSLEWLIEPYFILPIDWRTSGARSRMPGNEFWVGKTVIGDISSAGPSPAIAALYDLDIVWAEAFTAEPDHSAWRNDPWLMKPHGDRAFCSGVNHFYMHGFVHNPFDDRYQPGLTMGYWGTQMSRHLTWWPVSRGWHRYLARCQFMLRQGDPVIDVLRYPQKLEHTSYEFGSTGAYRQITLNDEALMTMLSVKDGRIMLPNGNSFAALILDPGQAVKPEALKKILELVKAGAILIGDPPPVQSPSLENYPEADQQLQQTIDELWNRKNTGEVLSGLTPEQHLDRIMGGPDFGYITDEADPDTILAMHRRMGNSEFWFVAYSGDQKMKTELQFRIKGKAPEFWDPVSGTTRLLPEYEQKGMYTAIPFEFFPRQSGFVVFTEQANSPARREGKNHPGSEVLAGINGPWEVRFDPRWGGPTEPVRFERLEDWTSRPEKGINYYSGIATYEARFNATGIQKESAGQKIWIDLGQVKNLADVKLNGEDLGYAWCAPWRVEVPSDLLKKKGNQLQIRVANTWVNRLIGDEQEPEDCEIAGPVLWFSSIQEKGQRMGGYNALTKGRGLKDLPDWLLNDQPRPSQGRYTFTSWRYYDRSAQLLPSGLLGPVRIVMETPE